MTDKEKLEKIKTLADKMYYRMAYLTSDTRPIRQAMDEYHQFIINEYHKEEPVSEDLEEAAQRYNEDMSWCWEAPRYPHLEAFKAGALWQKKQMMAKAVDATVHIDAGGYPYIPQMELYDYDKDIPFAKEGDKYKVILIKED